MKQSATETFVYDGLNRLDYSTLTTPGTGTITNQDLSYNAIGNILWKQDVGNYSYHASKKRAVIQAGTTSYGYDANGNMTSRGGSTIGYTSYNLPGVIYAGSNSSTLSYGAYRNRYKQVAVTAGISETTIYVGGILEKVTKSGTITWRHRIEGPGGLLAIVNCTGSSCDPTTTTHYLHRDTLGSPELITNSAGTELVKLSFGAFGERRDRDWHGAVSSADMAAIGNSTRRGFTEHEHLDAVGLIHMNGRVYDPVLGRFLASDPVADGLGRAGGFNRYAYVQNNPLTLIDPSGLSSKETKLPKHDAGTALVEATVLPGIIVTVLREWLPLGGTLAWAVVTPGSLASAYAFMPNFGGGGGAGGAGGGRGGGGGSDGGGGGDPNGREPPKSDPKEGAEKQPSLSACTFSASTQNRRDLASARKALANSAALGSDAAREIYISSRVIDGTISYRGSDGIIRTRAVDTASQRQAIGGSGLAGVAGRATLAYGAWTAGNALYSGMEYGNREDVAVGGLGLATLAVGASNPALAIGIGLGILIGELSYAPDHGSGSVTDALRNPCGPALGPAQ